MGYCCVRGGTAPLALTAISSHLRERLPCPMTLAHFEHLGDIPMTPQKEGGPALVGNGATAHVDREPIPAQQITPVPDPMAPPQKTSYIPTCWSTPSQRSAPSCRD